MCCDELLSGSMRHHLTSHLFPSAAKHVVSGHGTRHRRQPRPEPICYLQLHVNQINPRRDSTS